MAAITVGKGADDGHPVHKRGKPSEAAANGDAWNRCACFSGEAAILGRGGHFWVECLDVRRSPGQPDPDDGFLFDFFSRLGCCSAGAEQTWQGQAGENRFRNEIIAEKVQFIIIKILYY